MVPPSTIAYECMAMGIPVFLPGLAKQIPERLHGIAQEMVLANVARWVDQSWSWQRRHLKKLGEAGPRAVDGRGAERVADLLLGGFAG